MRLLTIWLLLAITLQGALACRNREGDAALKDQDTASSASGATVICSWRGDRAAAFTPTYDDLPGGGWESLTKVFEPLHEQYKLKGAVAITPQANWRPQGQWFPDGAGWPDFKAILDKGWLEPMNHTFTHPSLPDLPAGAIAAEFAQAFAAIKAGTGYEVRSLAYPFGNYDDKTIAVAKGHFMSARAFDDQRNTLGKEDRYVIHSLIFVGTTTAANVDQWFETALANHEWLVTTLHGIKEFADAWEPADRQIYEHELAVAAQRVASGELWNDNYSAVAGYAMERNASEVKTLFSSASAIVVRLSLLANSGLESLKVPLTLKTRVPSAWSNVRVVQGNASTSVKAFDQAGARYALFDAIPGNGDITLNMP